MFSDVPGAKGKGLRYPRSRMHICGGLRSRSQCHVRFAAAHAVKGHREGRRGSDDVLLDVDKGRSPDAQELAQQIQTAIETSQGIECTSSTAEVKSGKIVFSTSWEVNSCGVMPTNCLVNAVS